MAINIEHLESEYLTYVRSATGKDHEIEWNKLIALLCSGGGWTRQAAETLVSIVQDYGSFVLKNALALAIATNTEDGQLGL